MGSQYKPVMLDAERKQHICSNIQKALKQQQYKMLTEVSRQQLTNEINRILKAHNLKELEFDIFMNADCSLIIEGRRFIDRLALQNLLA